MKLAKEKAYIDEFFEINKDLLTDDLVKSMTQYRHHGEINTHFHSVYVAYCVLKMCDAFHSSKKSEIVRASLLHDFYLYEWYTEKHDELHIWYHPKESIKNIEEHFGLLTPMQKSMIFTHMFPLSKGVPASTGAWMLTAADKYVASQDYISVSSRFDVVYNEIMRKIDEYAD